MTSNVFRGTLNPTLLCPSYYLLALQLTKGNCLLGQTLVYERRLPKVECFNGELYERYLNATPCVCSQEDFEWYAIFVLF